ncbi:MAG: hypothetical protein JNM95_00920 [Chitinophagaceae bacterium]|nr:hypothetical protein [Chitinophagaceae bacterium]
MKNLLLLACFVLSSTLVKADFKSSFRAKHDRYRDPNFYTTSGIEAALFQFGDISGANFTDKNGKTIAQKMIPRFSYFFNVGADYNYKLDKNFSVFTGINVKNIGLIAKYDTLKFKHRVYTVGFPLGFRIHSADRKTWFKAGFDASWAVHYKKKTFVDNKKTEKYSAWFSDCTSTFFPSVFAGLSVGGVSVNTNVYLNNFFNPYNMRNFDYNGDLITLGLGINMNKTFKKKKGKKHEEATEAQ